MDSNYEGARGARAVSHEIVASVASHDLKAPLRGIQSLISFVLHDEAETLSPDSVEHLEKARRRAEHLLAMLDGLVRFLRLAEDAPTVDQVDLGEVVRRQVELHVPDDGFVCTFPTSLPSVVGPRPLVDAVVGNLLSNAVRHHDLDRGEITIESEERDGWTVVTVTDDGPGVPAGREVEIFRLFETAKPADRDQSTSGVGLAIVARAMAAMAGEVHCRRLEPRGVTFELRWPSVQGAETTR